MRTSIYKLLSGIIIFAVFLVLHSCDSGPKPDKIVKMTLGFDAFVDSDQNMDSIISVLNNKLKKITASAKVTKVSYKRQIDIEVETHYEVERLKKYILSRGKLGFYEVYTLEDMKPFIQDVNEQLKDTTVTEEETNPLFDLFAEEKSYSEQRPILFYIQEKDTALVRSYISSEKATASSAKKKYAKFLWGIKDKETDAYPLYAIKQTKSGKPVLSGAVVETAAQGLDYAGNPNVNLQMNEVGSKIWERMTAKASSEQSYIAIVVGEEVYSAPGVSHGPIEGGMSVISGNFTIEEAQDFANVLESGQIPKAELIHFDVDIFE